MSNKLFSDANAVLGVIGPVSQGAGAVSTPWISASQFATFAAVIKTGVLGASATLDARLEQATTAAGAGVKDIVGKSITQIVKATGDNKQAIINLREEDLDLTLDYGFFRLTVTVGVAASLIDATVFGYAGRYEPASDYGATSVAQVIYG
ncbi:hypothetical protein ACN2C7_10975 [Caulobacter sp. ErkDOM-E]|uniref:hypothetical protein n=1 Tax=Caulobacter sp. ErkDOM-E TaxID=3402778 RepID=UPI003AF8B0F2